MRSLRLRLLLLLGALHVALAAAGVAAFSARPWTLLALEAGLVASVLVSASIVRAVFAPLALVRTGAELLREADFTARIALTGQPELDALADVYNRMADRLRGERARAAEQDLFLQRLVDASPAGVVTLDLDGRVSLVSPSAEALLGISAADAVGRDLAAIPGAGPLAALRDQAKGAPEASRLVELGGRRLRMRRAAFHDRGFPREFFLVEELTDELEESERRAHERIVRVMAHEVRNTVGVVRSLLDSLRSRAQGGSLDAEALEIASDRLMRLNAFMNAVADVVQIPDPALVLIDLGSMVRDVVALAEPEARARGLRLVACSDESVLARVDRGLLEQALLNVLRNALDASPPGGIVRVSLARREGAARLSVRDEGPGLAPEAASRAFTPFFTTKPGGHGVGLMLVREVLRRHGIAHELRSCEGGGAEFTADFGIVPADGSSPRRG